MQGTVLPRQEAGTPQSRSLLRLQARDTPQGRASRQRSALSRALAVSLKNGAAFLFAPYRADTGPTPRSLPQLKFILQFPAS